MEPQFVGNRIKKLVKLWSENEPTTPQRSTESQRQEGVRGGGVENEAFNESNYTALKSVRCNEEASPSDRAAVHSVV